MKSPIIRRGNTFSAYWSADGVTFNKVEREVNLSLNPKVFIGLAVPAHNEGALNKSVFDNIKIERPQP